MAATATAALVISLSLATSTSAASPGVFNIVNCNPGARTIEQQIEFYRSYPTETVWLLGALYNTGTGQISYSQWMASSGATAYAVFNWTNVAAGNYRVFYLAASWDTSQQQYTFSPWHEVPAWTIQTYGQETYPGSEIFIGGTNGRCDM